jgi:hypothetical protein
MTGHSIVIATWEQGRRKGEPYERLYEARCGPCRWLSPHTANQWQARLWADKHAGVDRTAPEWQRGPGGAG